MLSERVLRTVMRRINYRNLRLDDATSQKLPDPVPGREYMLYVHIPFCERLCPYCSFNRYAYDRSVADAYFEHLKEDMRHVAEQGYRFSSLYVGGGTPTIDLPALVEIIDLARELFPIREVSSETNPNHLSPEYIDALSERVDRFSVGVQSFDDGLLRQMDRYEKYGSAAQILERLQAIEGRFHSLNVDMIFNFPSQTAEMVEHDAEMLIASGANQATFYPLMASPAVAASLKRTVGKVDYAREQRYYQLIADSLKSTHEPASAWTFSRVAGGMIDEYIVDYDDYVGIGSGSFSFLGGTLYATTFSLKRYNELVASHRSAVTKQRTFGRHDQMRYRFLMRLFGLELDKARFERDFGISIDRALPVEMAFMRSVGAFEVDDDARLVPNHKGRYLLLVMMREFFIGVNNLRDQARAALPPEERKLLFGDGKPCEPEHGHSLAAAAADTEMHEETPIARR